MSLLSCTLQSFRACPSTANVSISILSMSHEQHHGRSLWYTEQIAVNAVAVIKKKVVLKIDTLPGHRILYLTEMFGIAE